MDVRLERLGDELESAAGRELRRRKGTVRKRFAVAIAAVVVLVPTGAFAADHLLSTGDVAASMPAGTLALLGTHPTCTTVTDGVEYHCVLAKAPAPEVSDWKGTVEPTVDATKHVNGGCRSLTSSGTEWECYVGQAAVGQQIIGETFLGAYSPSPAVRERGRRRPHLARRGEGNEAWTRGGRRCPAGPPPGPALRRSRQPRRPPRAARRRRRSRSCSAGSTSRRVRTTSTSTRVDTRSRTGCAPSRSSSPRRPAASVPERARGGPRTAPQLSCGRRA